MVKKDWLSEIFPELEVLEADQERVARDYRERFKLTHEEFGKLHMFFSPTRVIEGMTEDGVRILILLFDLRDQDRAATFSTHPNPLSNSIIEAIALPSEFIFTGDLMTRERFKDGVFKFLQQVVTNKAQQRIASH